MTDTWTWATVTQATPLRIKVDGDTSALNATTGDLVGSLAVDDRVRVHLHADGIIVTGLQGGGDPIIPVGGGITWWGASDPASPGGGIEYAIPDGRALSRTTYAVLFALWGTTFGTGNGTSTFNMPNAKGRVQVGRDSADSDFNTMGETRGSKTHTLTVDEMPSHTHNVRNTELGGPGTTRYTINSAADYALTSPTSVTGGDDAHNNIQPSIVANTAIRIK